MYSRYYQSIAPYAPVSVTATTWDIANSAGVNLTNSDLTATITGGAGGFANSTTGRNSGLLYYETTLGGPNTFVSPAWYAAIIDVSASSFPTGWNYAQNFIWNVNGANAGPTAIPVSGDLCAVAINFTTKKIWYTTSSGGGATGWNAGTGDPAAGTGGADFTAGIVSGTFKIAFSFPSDNSSITLNTTGGFSYLPSGFSAWG